MTTQLDPDGKGPPILSRSVARIAARMANEDSFGTGPRAELRRLDPNGGLAEPTLHRLLARHVTEAALTKIGLPAWALVIHCTALAVPGRLAVPSLEQEPKEAGKQAEFWSAESRRAQQKLGQEFWGDDPKRPLYGERRFANLLDAGADELRVALPRAVRFLIAAGGKLPILAVADLVVSAPSIEDEPAWSIRHRIARGYYLAEAKPPSDQTKSSLGDAA